MLILLKLSKLLIFSRHDTVPLRLAISNLLVLKRLPKHTSAIASKLIAATVNSFINHANSGLHPVSPVNGLRIAIQHISYYSFGQVIVKLVPVKLMLGRAWIVKIRQIVDLA